MNPAEYFDIPKLAEDDLREADERHLALLQEMRDTPEEGRLVEHLGREFIVLPDVFPPYADSVPLLKHVSFRSNERVLDVGCGSGVLSIFAALRGAKEVVSVDINPNAVTNTLRNAARHGVSDKIDVRQSDLFDEIKSNETFDVVVANLPFRNREAEDLRSRSVWDTDFLTHRRFFANVGNVLKKHGRMYMVHASFGDLETFLTLAHRRGFHTELLETYYVPNERSRAYYVYELTRH